MNHTIHVGDCTTVKPDGLFHAVLCDPPYHLVDMSNRYGKTGSESRKQNNPHSRTHGGFMGKQWDGGDVAFDPDTWRKIGESLHPGGFLMAFASSRGWHRLACAIEDAGFIIHPTIFGWAFGSGFPKATRIDTQVDKAAGAEREVLGRNPNDRDRRENALADYGLQGGVGSGLLTAPATPLARAWAGHRYGLQALKPAVEPIIVAQKPYSGGKPVDCITRTGAGALNVDGGRIACDDKAIGGSGQINYDPEWKAKAKINPNCRSVLIKGGYEAQTDKTQGRWPANFILLDEEAAAALDRQSGDSTTPKTVTRGAGGQHGAYSPIGRQDDVPCYGDTGGASRFFYNVQSQLDAADPIRYQAKASRRERDAGLEGLPEVASKSTGWSGDTMPERRDTRPGRTQQTRPEPKSRNHHPTVKPIDLARYLATLLLPPAEYAPRRILVPFSGVGSEMIGAMLAGWEEVVGIEQDAEYADIARRRIEHWTREKEKVLL